MKSTLIRLDKDIIEKLKELNKGSMNNTVRFLLDRKVDSGVSQAISDEIDKKLRAMKLLIDNTYEPLIEQLQKSIRR